MMSCFYGRDGVYVCQTRQGGGKAGAKEKKLEESQALVAQLKQRESAKLQLADALASGGMGADLDGYAASQELGYEEPPQPGAFLEGTRRPAPDQGMQLSNLAPEPRPMQRQDGTRAAAARGQTVRSLPNVPRVASLTYSS